MPSREPVRMSPSTAASRAPPTPPSRWAARGPWLVAGLWIFVVSMLGGLATEVGPWYYSLEQPPWKPPDWLFGPAWLTIYVFTALSAVGAWNACRRPSERRLLVGGYVLNAVLNVGWGVLFFAWRRPDWALWDVAALGLSVVGLMVVSRHRPISVALLVPYLAWVCFAGALNAAVVERNGPFTASANLAQASSPNPGASPAR